MLQGATWCNFILHKVQKKNAEMSLLHPSMTAASQNAAVAILSSCDQDGKFDWQKTLNVFFVRVKDAR